METSLNRTQKKISRMKVGPILVTAGPGSGKTRVLTARAAYLATEEQIPAQRMIIVTFTKAAADEMHKRISEVVDSALVSQMHTQTIHSLAYQYVEHVHGRPNLMDDRTRRHVIQAITKRLGLEEDAVDIYLQEYSNCINRCMSSSQYTPANIGKKEFEGITRRYQGQKQQQNLMDFDDLLTSAYAILKRARSIPGRYIMVDEFQDTSLLQYEILKLLARPTNHFFVVGDDDQSIYSWRGGCNAPLLFVRDFPEAEQVPLEINYRSTKQIVAVSTSMIKENTQRLVKDLRPVHHRKEGNRPEFVTPADEQQEAENVCTYLKDKYREGVSWQEMAVVYRTKYQGVLVQQVLAKEKIPYRILGEQIDIVDHWIGRDILAYLQLAVDETASEPFFHVLNRPGRYISTDMVYRAKALVERLNITPAEALRRQTLSASQEKAISRLEADLSVLKSKRAEAAMKYIRENIGLDNHIVNFADHIGGNHEEYLQIAEIMAQLSGKEETIDDFVSRIPDIKSQSVSQTSLGVTLTTCHSAKGLEYAVVAVIGCVEGVLPHHKATDCRSAKAALEEERRLAYVAVTRAKEHLLVSSPAKSGRKKTKPSRFVQEMKKGVIRKKLSEVDTIDHPRWGSCSVQELGDTRAVLVTEQGDERQVLVDWLVQKDLI